MRKARIGFSSLMLTMLVAGAPLRAESNKLALSLGAGLPTSANSFSDSARVGAAAGVSYLRGVRDRISVGGRLNYFNFPANTHRIGVNGGGKVDADSASDAMTLELIGRYDLSPIKRLTPFLVGGIGANYFSQKTKATPAAGSLWSNTATQESRTIADDSSMGAAFSVGAGVDMALGDRLGLGFEAIWHTLTVSKSDFGSASINFPSVALNLNWLF
jgi:opacity protein-like surface antigen